MIIIREGRQEDEGAVRAVNEKAFGQPDEADIVDRLRQSCPCLLFLVALVGDEIVGHILNTIPASASRAPPCTALPASGKVFLPFKSKEKHKKAIVIV